MKNVDGAKNVPTAKEASERTAKEVAEKASNISPEMAEKILEGQRKVRNGTPTNKIIGGHSSKINNSNPKYAVEVLQNNADGTRVVKYVKDISGDSVSKIKQSTLFPETWSDKKIIDSSINTANTTALAKRISDDGVVTTLHRQVVDGVEVEVLKVGNDVVSSYPTGGTALSFPTNFNGM